MFDRQHWQACLTGLGLPPNLNTFEELAASYSHPSRYYHNQHHIADCLQRLKSYQHLADRPYEIALAIWFHDAIYDTRRRDNEERSAAWARTYLRQVQASEDIIDRISSLILATQTHTHPNNSDQALLLDIDLSILGQPTEIFQDYDRAIRQEYDWVPETHYRSARCAILQDFLDRPNLYHTAEFRTLYEAPARHNLTEVLKRLDI